MGFVRSSHVNWHHRNMRGVHTPQLNCISFLVESTNKMAIVLRQPTQTSANCGTVTYQPQHNRALIHLGFLIQLSARPWRLLAAPRIPPAGPVNAPMGITSGKHSRIHRVNGLKTVCSFIQREMYIK